MLEFEAGRAREEGGELIGAVADNGDPLGFEKLERLSDVENRFGAGANDCDAGTRKLDQIGRDVERFFNAAVHAADAACGEDFDARKPSDEHRRRDRRAGRALASGHERQIAPRSLHDAAAQLAESIDLLPLEAHSQAAVNDRNRRRNGAHLAHRILDGERRLDIAGKGHAMGDDRRFERDDRLFGRSGIGDLGGKIHKIGGAHRWFAFVAGGRDRPFQRYRQSPLMINGANLCRKAIPGSDRVRSSGFALRLHRSATKFESMDDKPDHVPVQPDLVASIRQARIENAERGDAIAEARELEIARLKALESALEPVVDQAPQGVDLFDMALTQSEHPRLFLDMIAFVDMAHDKRTYRFFQDTRQGRVLMAESQSADTIVAAVADYVARRLVERERAVTVDSRVAEGPRVQPAEASGPATWPIARPRPRALHLPPADASEPLPVAEQPRARPRRGIMRRLGDVLSLFLMLLGSITLALLLGIGVYWAWITRLSDLWARWIGPPPF